MHGRDGEALVQRDDAEGDVGQAGHHQQTVELAGHVLGWAEQDLEGGVADDELERAADVVEGLLAPEAGGDRRVDAGLVEGVHADGFLHPGAGVASRLEQAGDEQRFRVPDQRSLADHRVEVVLDLGMPAAAPMAVLPAHGMALGQHDQ